MGLCYRNKGRFARSIFEHRSVGSECPLGFKHCQLTATPILQKELTLLLHTVALCIENVKGLL